MTDWLQTLGRTWHTPGGALQLVASLVIGTCVVATFAAVLVNFALYGGRGGVREERKSVVATGSMTLFFVAYYLLIRWRVGVVPVPWEPLRVALAIAGLALVAGGCVVNILGRLCLGHNWANQATIYRDQGLVTTGVYALVRHPLYASLIWMFAGASLVHANAAAFAANALVFVPFMIYRARLEEALLAREFGAAYAAYRRRVGMFVYWPGRRSGTKTGEEGR